jgi:hypothetical protein
MEVSMTRTSDQLDQIAPALVGIHNELRAIVKDSKNPAFKSKYASLDAILDTIRPILVRNGCFVTQTVTEGATHNVTMRRKQNNEQTEQVVETFQETSVFTITAASRCIHLSGQWIESISIVPVAKFDAHGLGAAQTYARRFSLASLLALATDDDDDGNASTIQHAPRHVAATPDVSVEFWKLVKDKHGDLTIDSKREIYREYSGSPTPSVEGYAIALRKLQESK